MSLKITAIALAGLAAMTGAAEARNSHADLVKLWREWRAFEAPVVENCAPDYTPARMAQKAESLADFQKRLAAIRTDNWSTDKKADHRLVEAEMNGLDFDLRVLQPWARDPSFYAIVFAEESDVPEHEGPNARPAIDLYEYSYPLSKSDQRELACRIGAVPALLEQAKKNLENSNARDLWAYADRAFRWQAGALDGLEAGTLEMRTLDGPVKGSLDGASDELRAAVDAAQEATAQFRSWIAAQAPSKTGVSGVGKENYDWYMKNVHLVSYGWDEQVALLRRELERARASLALEEFNNRDLPAQEPVDEEAAWAEMAKGRMNAFADFLIGNDLVADKDYYRKALDEQIGGFTPPEDRNFFTIGAAIDPMPLYTHFYHWIELARREHEPQKNPIRAAEPLYDIYDSRSEGLATAVEELFMHAGLYADSPRSREIVWIMLANRAARGLASLYVQSNDMTLAEAGKFHARWTPRAWSDPTSDLVGFEQLLYLRQPGYGTSYVAGKLELDRLISDYAFAKEQKGEEFSLPTFFRDMNESGVIPFSLIRQEIAPAASDAESAKD
ncbi:MAG: DUF885 family protein [Parvularculaceae bacterium]|nr:DUF885 family protein [Parvularculaceae bacterium]